MKPAQYRVVSAVFLGAFLLCAGCMTSSEETEGLFGSPSPAATTTPAHLVTEPVIIKDPVLEGVEVTIDATDDASITGNLLIRYTLDASKLGGVMHSQGYDILFTGFAYNYDDVTADFRPGSYQDIIRAGIPYKSTRIRLFPTNIITGSLEVGSSPKDGRVLDISRPYNYGVVLWVQPE